MFDVFLGFCIGVGFSIFLITIAMSLLMINKYEQKEGDKNNVSV